METLIAVPTIIGLMIVYLIQQDKQHYHQPYMSCPKCLGKLEIEKEIEIDYPYVCYECDENFYEFETK